MFYLLEILIDFASVWTWVYILVGIYLIIFIVYFIGSSGVQKNVIITTAEKADDGYVTADLSYYLPRAKLIFTAVAKIQGEKLLSFEIKPTVSIEADTSRLYLMKYVQSFYSDDEIEFKVDQNGLLQNLRITTEDKIKSIISEIAEAPGNILNEPEVHYLKKGTNKSGEEKIITVTRTFQVSPQQLSEENITFEWNINAGNKTVDASFILKKSLMPLKHLSHKEQVSGILTRPLRSERIELKLKSGILMDDIVMNIIIPDQSVLIHVPIIRSSFVKRTHNPKLSGGILIENKINKPSQFEAFASIPVNILKSIISIPAQILSFRINLLKKETALENTQKELTQLRTVAQKHAEITDKLKEDIEDIKKGVLLNNVAISENNRLDSNKEEGIIYENIPDKIFIEAIKKYEDKWKSDFNVLDISAGFKTTDGVVTEKKALIFRPLEKTDEVSRQEVPEYIDFSSKDGSTYRLLTDVQKTGGLILPSLLSDPGEYCDANTPKLPGCSVSRLDSKETGTIGLKIYRNKRSFLLSCYHVICSEELANGVNKVVNRTGANMNITSPSFGNGGTRNNIIGTVTEGVLNKYMDAAIAELKDDLDLHERICRTNLQPKEPLMIDSSYINMDVYLSGDTSRLSSGYITSYYTTASIEYSTGTIDMEGMISTTKMSAGGDSGAAVFDQRGKVIGILVATSPSNSYILPIMRILAHFRASLTP